MKAALAYMMVLGDLLRRDKVCATGIKTYPVEQKKVIEQLSRQKIAKMKGKKNRMNRGRNRRKKIAHEDTAMYSMLRR